MGRVAPVWFRRGAQPLWEKYILPLKDQIKTYMEIGTGEGGSVRWVLENLPVELAVTVDPFIGDGEGREGSARLYLAKWLPPKMNRFDSPLKMVKQKSFEFLTSGWRNELFAEFIKAAGWFDFIYVDGDHDCFPALTDCVLSWYLLKRGGIMAMDDRSRDWRHTRHGLRPRTKQAVDSFLMCITGEYETLFDEPNQVCIRRL